MLWRTGRLNDRKLVAAFLADRSEQRFRELYRRHTPRMLRFARRLGQSQTTSEDVVQEAWVRAVQSLPSFEWRSSLGTWLAGFVANVVREQRRADSRRDGAMDLVEEPSALDALTMLSLGGALESLSPGYRAVLTLHDLGGFTHQEIGAILGIDPGTSKSQLTRARRRARELLGRTST